MIGRIDMVEGGLLLDVKKIGLGEIPDFIRLLEGYAKLLKDPKRTDWRTPARESLAASGRALWVRMGRAKAEALMNVAAHGRDVRVLSDDEARSARRFLDTILDCEAA